MSPSVAALSLGRSQGLISVQADVGGQACSLYVVIIQTRSRKQSGRSSSEKLLTLSTAWCSYVWNVSGNEDWSPSRNNSIYHDWGLNVSCHVQILVVVYVAVAEGQWEQTWQQHMLIKIICASFHTRPYCCLTAWILLDVDENPNRQQFYLHSHAQQSTAHTPV